MNQYEMSEEEKQAEAQSWKRWKSPETWGNTDSGAHTHGWVSGRNYALAAAEAQRNALAAENARLREGLQAVLTDLDSTVSFGICVVTSGGKDRAVRLIATEVERLRALLAEGDHA
jgi:beta-phosphoglucomutase-like phosphatase (HAD superfamily)